MITDIAFFLWIIWISRKTGKIPFQREKLTRIGYFKPHVSRNVEIRNIKSYKSGQRGQRTQRTNTNKDFTVYFFQNK